MSSPHDFSATAFLALVSGTEGHFLLESGYHTSLWLDLDTLFADPRRIAPWVARLAVALRPYDVSVVCGAMVGDAFFAQLLATALDIEFCFALQTPGAPDETTTSSRLDIASPRLSETGCVEHGRLWWMM